MSSERINNNISIKKLEKTLINLPYSKLPSFRINPFSPKETSILNLTVQKNCTSSSPSSKNIQKDSKHVLPLKKKDQLISLSSDKDKMSIDSTKHSFNKSHSKSHSQSETKPNSIPLPINNISIINNSILQTKTENLNAINNLTKINQNLNTPNPLYLPYNEIIPKTTTNEKTIFNHTMSGSNKSFSEGIHGNQKKLVFANSTLQNSINSNSITKQNNFNISLKNKSNCQSPIHERKIESRFNQYQMNIKMNNNHGIIRQNPKILNLSHKLKSPPKEINLSSAKHSFVENNNYYNHNTSFQNYFVNINNYEPSKFGLKSNGIVTSYAANTNQGLYRYY